MVFRFIHGISYKPFLLLLEISFSVSVVPFRANTYQVNVLHLSEACSKIILMQSTQKLNQWINRLNKEELPAFAHTARSMASTSTNNDSSANDLANAILKDSVSAITLSDGALIKLTDGDIHRSTV